MPDIRLWYGWRIAGVIGNGSFGTVYEIHRQNGAYLERAALKVIRIPKDQSELEQLRMDGMTQEDTESYFQKHVEQIRNEIGLMQQFVGFSNIVSYEDYLIQKHENNYGWDILIRMELLKPLPTYLTEHRLTETEIIRLGLDISQALMICHDAGIIHRDIKPQNIFINSHGFFKLGDFGISRAMPGSGSVLSFKGTIAYMAPETFAVKDTDGRSDIYSLALVLYRILNGGKEPFLMSTDFSPEEREKAQRRRLTGEPLPDPARGSIALCRVLSIALAPDPADRYQTAAQFHKALKSVQEIVLAKEGAYETRELHSYFNVKEFSNEKNRNSVRRGRSSGIKTVSEFRGDRSGSFPEKDISSVHHARRFKNIILIGIGVSSFLILIALLFVLQEIEQERGGGNDPSGEYQIAEASEDGYQIDDELEETEETADETTALQENVPTDSHADNVNTESLNAQEGSSDDAPADEESMESIDLDEKVSFADPALDKAVRLALEMDEDQVITVEKALTIEKLDLTGGGKEEEDKISDLSGMSAFSNLKELDLQKNHIMNIEELSSLKKLKKLMLEYNSIQDLSPLQGLDKLRKLEVAHNDISDITPIMQLEELETLDVIGNHLYSIKGIGRMAKLHTLRIGRNHIKDISPVTELQDLKSLGIAYNGIEDISALYQLPLLHVLTMNGNQVEDIGPVAYMPELRYLEVKDNPIKNIEILNDLPEGVVKER